MPPFIEMTGQRFGRLTVIKKIPRKGTGNDARWLCQCDCGNMTEVTRNRLKGGSTKSCGCLSKELVSKRSLHDLTGKVFGRLIVINRAEDAIHGPSKIHKVKWHCKCECGNEVDVLALDLVHGNTKSCKCSFKLPHGEASLNALYYKYKNGGRFDKRTKYYNSARLIFDLTKEQFRALTSQNCYYCGCEPGSIEDSQGSNGAYIYNGLDRIDNNKGYTLNNIVTCCRACNFYKGSKSQEEFLSWIKRVSEFHNAQ